MYIEFIHCKKYYNTLEKWKKSILEITSEIMLPSYSVYGEITSKLT